MKDVAMTDDTVARFLAGVYHAATFGEPGAASSLLRQQVQRLLQDDDLEGIDTLLRDADPYRLASLDMRELLAVSLPHAEQLPSRVSFVQRCLPHLNKRLSQRERQRILSGLC